MSAFGWYSCLLSVFFPFCHFSQKPLNTLIFSPDIWEKNHQESTEIMLHVHRRGVGLCGVYTYEVAETKVAQVMEYARANEQPLQCTMEKE